jgi:hypothetical protein
VQDIAAKAMLLRNIRALPTDKQAIVAAAAKMFRKVPVQARRDCSERFICPNC